MAKAAGAISRRRGFCHGALLATGSGIAFPPFVFHPPDRGVKRRDPRPVAACHISPLKRTE